MITGLIDPTSGHALLDGRDVRDDLTAFRKRLGYVPEEAILGSCSIGTQRGGLRS